MAFPCPMQGSHQPTGQQKVGAPDQPISLRYWWSQIFLQGLLAAQVLQPQGTACSICLSLDDPIKHLLCLAQRAIALQQQQAPFMISIPQPQCHSPPAENTVLFQHTDEVLPFIWAKSNLGGHNSNAASLAHLITALFWEIAENFWLIK